MVIAVELCDHVHVYGMVPPRLLQVSTPPPPGECLVAGPGMELGAWKPWLGGL